MLMRHIMVVSVALVFILATTDVFAQDSNKIQFSDSDFSGDPDEPRRHSRVTNPATLSGAEAQAIYDELTPEMETTFGLSPFDIARAYRSWDRFNTAPYRSATHGQRFVNNYANDVAVAYGRYEDAGVLPVGSVLVKDSFTATDDGMAEAGPLFVMEKREDGFNYVTGNWRYTLILADGTVYGQTLGDGAQRVEYCISCHLAASVGGSDHVFFVPEAFRLP